MNRIATRTASLACGLALLTAVGCGSSSPSAEAPTTTAEATTTTAPATLKIEDVWARTSPSMVTLGATYLRITSPVDDELTGASAPTSVAKKTEIHETVPVTEGSTTTGGMGGTTEPMGTTTVPMGGTTTPMGGGEMEMRPVSSIALPAGKTVALEPGGYHVMLIDLVAPLRAGQTFDLTLTFKVAGTRTVTVTVRDS